MRIPMYQVDAFTSERFRGNPAAVCRFDEWPEDRLLQAIAAENNLAETAFLVKRDGYYDLRWFTPKAEVDLCGHATLASAFIIFTFLEPQSVKVDFQSKSGLLTVRKSAALLMMEFPARPPVPLQVPVSLIQALGTEPRQVLKSRDLLAIFENETIIREIRPDFERLKQLREYLGVIITAPGDQVDFVSRFFAPNVGVPEDPVTGSAHATLIPYWAERLGKSRLHARQLSERGGELFCEDLGERVIISGNAVLYLTGEICI